MPWFKVDDGFANSKQVVRIPRKFRCAAVGLWTLAGTWSSKELTDGFVPEHMLEELAATKADAGRLVEAELWCAVDGGWQFVGWEKYQPTRVQVLAERDKEADRKRRWREAKTGKSDPRPPAPSEECPTGTTPSVPPVSRTESVLPDPTRPVPKELATHLERQSHVSSPGDAEQPRGPAVDPSGWKLVRDAIPAEHPQAVRTDLAIRAGTLLKSGTPPADIRDALALWLTKPNLGPGVLPSLVSEVVRNRTQPAPGITTDGAATAKARGWLAVGEELDHASRISANAAVPQRNPTAIAACNYCDEAGWRTPPPELRDADPPVAKCDHGPGIPAAWRTLIARLLDAPTAQKAIRS